MNTTTEKQITYFIDTLIQTLLLIERSDIKDD